MAVGETLPEIGVGLSYGYMKIVGQPQWNGFAFAKVSVPLTDWWASSHKIRRSQIKVEKAENDRKYLQTQLTLKAHMLWEGVNAAWDELQISEDAHHLAEVSYERLKSRYSAGDATITDLLQAGNDLNMAENELVDAKIAYRLALNKYAEMSKK